MNREIQMASTYRASLPYDSHRIHAAAIYCSDGRFGEQCDDFLQNAIGLPRYDRLILPGGAACLAGHFDVFRQADVVLDQLSFLVRVHELEQLVLIAHQGCAFYARQLGITTDRVDIQQREDLAVAAARIRSACNLKVHGFFAALRDNRIEFEGVSLPEDQPGW